MDTSEEEGSVACPFSPENGPLLVQILPTLPFYTSRPTQASYMLSTDSIRSHKLGRWGRGCSGHTLVAAKLTTDILTGRREAETLKKKKKKGLTEELRHKSVIVWGKDTRASLHGSPE